MEKYNDVTVVLQVANQKTEIVTGSFINDVTLIWDFSDPQRDVIYESFSKKFSLK